MTSLYPVVVAAPVIGLATYCFTQIAIARLASKSSPYRSLTIGFVAGLAMTTAAVWGASRRMEIRASDQVGYVLLDILTYLALAFGYFNFVNLTVASLRIRLLEELNMHGGELARHLLVEKHSSRNVAALRIERLLDGGHLVERNGRVFSGKPWFLMVARFFDALRWGIMGRESPSE
jgi:hypothetical protein